MFDSKEARKLSEDAKKVLNKEALDMVEAGIIAACKRGEEFAEFQRIPDSVVAVLKEYGYSVVIANIVIKLDGASKTISGFKVYW